MRVSIVLVTRCMVKTFLTFAFECSWYISTLFKGDVLQAKVKRTGTLETNILAVLVLFRGNYGRIWKIIDV